jgi:hypothetical protein
MSDFITGIDAGLLALGLAMAMLAAWGIGWLIGCGLRRDDGQPPEFKFDDASLALLGLLLAFTFSTSLGKHDQRRTMSISDSNAIGDFYTCASLIKEPVRAQLQALIHEYAEFRYNLPGRKLDRAAMEDALEHIQAMQAQMTELVGKALDAGTPIAVPLTNTLNDVTSMHAARLAAIRDRLPVTIVLLLFTTAIVCTLLIGRQESALRKPQIAGTLSFILLVSLVVYVTLDLNQPYRGLIHVSQETLQRLLSSMGK